MNNDQSLKEMAKILRDYADAFEEQFCCKLPPRRYIGDPADCAAPEMRRAAEMLERLSEEKQSSHDPARNL